MIVLDIDGVVADLFCELDFMLDQAGYETSHWSEWPGYHWDEVYPNIPRDELEKILLDPMLIKNTKPFEDAWYWVNHFSSTYDIMFLTARDKSLTSKTWEWFRDWDIPVDFVVFEPNKVDFLKQIQVNVYVDDHPDMVQQAYEAGINAYLMNRPYNVGYDVEESIRINSLWDIGMQ